MQIQVNSDNHVENCLELTGQVEGIVTHILGRFSGRITRVEVHLTDENSSAKGGSHDKRCALEARLNGMQPVAVTDTGGTVEQAVKGASDKMRTLLDRTLGRLNDPKGRASFAGGQG